MKESYYNYCFSHNGNQYVYNSLSGAFAKTNNEFAEILNAVRADSLWESDSETFNKMKMAGIIVDNSVNEYELYKDAYEKSKLSDSACTFTIAPSLSCNFRCPYCYESKNKYIMTDDHVKKLIEFIKRSLCGKKVCRITWYGGEPIICKKIIYQISDEIIAFCNSQNIDYSATIVTNGYLLNDEIITKLVERKIKYAQITLDGDRVHHNKKRFLEDGSGTYDKILENIKKMDLSGIRLSVRINVDNNNADDMEELFNDLKSLELKNTFVYFGLLAASTEACASIASSCLTNEQFSEKTLIWNKELFEKGLFSSMLKLYPSRIVIPCAAITPLSVVVDSYGRFYKCWDDIGLEEKSVGNLDNDESLPLKKSPGLCRYLDWNPFAYEECVKCKVLPLCGGFCSYMAQANGAPICSKWKYILIEYLKQVIDSSSNK